MNKETRPSAVGTGFSDPVRARVAAEVFCAAIVCGCLTAGAEAVFPGKEWEQKEPAQLGLDPALLNELSTQLGGRGCVIKDGYVVRTWGDQVQRSDWFSSAKPVFSTLLFFAIEEGLVQSVDQRITDFGWPLKQKDQTMTFRHLGGMIGGYARPEAPGEAWAYNDYAIQLYQKTLFDKVFKADPETSTMDPKRLGGLGLQDGLTFKPATRRMSASVRDFARITWFWLNRGRWGDRQLLPRRYFDEYMKPQVPKVLLLSEKPDTDDYLKINTFGGGSAHFTKAGPGIYGFNWWFNGTGQRHQHALTWPDAPPDTVMSLGAQGNSSAIMPSLGLTIVCAKGNWGDITPGNPAAQMNQVLKLAAAAAGYRPDPQALITGELRKWHPVTLSFVGPELSETGTPNPFLDYRLEVTFQNGSRRVVVPGYYAADGNASETSASSGRVWRVHFTPDHEGTWIYRASFREGHGIAVADTIEAGKPVAFDGMNGTLTIGPADKSAPGFLSKGVLRYVGERYLRFAETGEAFIKGGADSPENFLGYADFDQTPKARHKYEAHAKDWHPGDPVWQETKGKNIIGALNYLASMRMNSVYMIIMNVKGDGKDVWPWTDENERERFDCSKLDQWDLVFDHMSRKGLMLHVIHQEQENDQLLDNGELGPHRRLYYRQLIARFGYHPALVWNLGEENTNTDAQRKVFTRYIRDLDPYDHPIVVHTFPDQMDQVYKPLLGYPCMEGASLQMGDMGGTHRETLKWVDQSKAAGRPWMACLDEIGPAQTGVKTDGEDPEHAVVMRQALWGNLMAGGAGAEWYFSSNWPPRRGPSQDVQCEDWRQWENMWNLTAVALDFFHRHLPFTEMQANDKLVSPNTGWCLEKPGEVYAVYVWGGADAKIMLPQGTYTLHWYDPRKGGQMTLGASIAGPGWQALGTPPADPNKDWVVLIRANPS